MTEIYQRVAVHALIVNDVGQYLVAHRALTNDHEPDKIDLFGGSVELGEKMTDGLARELFEEAKIKVKIVRLTHEFDFMSGPNRHQFQFTYLCKYQGGEIKYEADDHDWHRWVTLDELVTIPNKIGFLESLCNDMVEGRIKI